MAFEAQLHKHSQQHSQTSQKAQTPGRAAPA